jgi:hypothetical protein
MSSRPHLAGGPSCRRSPPRPRCARARGGWVLGVVLVLGLVGLPYASGPGQVVAATLSLPQSQEEAARARYVQAREAFQALQSEALELEPRVIQISLTLETYRERGDLRSLEDAFINDYLPGASRLQSLNIQSEEAKRGLDESRRELLRLLRARESVLLSELEQGPTAAREQTINQRIVEIRREVNELEREREPLAEVGFRPVPRLPAYPTDGPRELRAKAQHLERIAETFASQLEFLDEEIRVREDRLRLQRGFQDARDGIGRFDGDRPVGTGPPGRTTAGQAADERAGDAAESTLVFSELPLPEQIERLRSVRTQAEESRDEALSQATELRRLAGARERGGA